MTVTLLIFNWLWELQACGPFFPNWLLVNTKDNITSHPLFDFDKELLSMRLVHPYFKAVNQKDNFDYPVDTLDAEIADLLKALEMEGLASDNRKLIADNHRIERKRISVSSLGWEADILWDDNKYTESFDLYLQQAAGGDLIALISLRLP